MRANTKHLSESEEATMEDIKDLEHQTACVSIDCDVEELEDRIAPGINLGNHNETMLQDRS
jgi:hypothetical protein